MNFVLSIDQVSGFQFPVSSSTCVSLVLQFYGTVILH